MRHFTFGCVHSRAPSTTPTIFNRAHPSGRKTERKSSRFFVVIVIAFIVDNNLHISILSKVSRNQQHTVRLKTTSIHPPRWPVIIVMKYYAILMWTHTVSARFAFVSLSINLLCDETKWNAVKLFRVPSSSSSDNVKYSKKKTIEKDADDEVRPLFIPISVDGDATAAESGATSRAVFVRTKYYSLLCLAVIRIMYARRIR